jgi:hypothetical protein
MRWGSEKTAGFVLGALLADDRELTRLQANLSPALYALVAERCAALPREARAKAQALRELIDQVRPELLPQRLPARARALIAPRLPRELGRALLREAKESRAGYLAEPGLVALLERLARKRTGDSA